MKSEDRTSHLSPSDIENFVQGRVAPERLIIIDRHWSECDECFARIGKREQMERMITSMPDLQSPTNMDPHLSYEQLAGYVDGQIDDVSREIVDVHKTVCESCSTEIDQLLQLRSTLTLESVPLRTGSAAASSGFWNWITASPFFRIAGPAFGLMIIGFTAWYAWVLMNDTASESVRTVEPPHASSKVGDGNNAVNGPDPTESENTLALSPQPAILLTDGGSQIGIDDQGNVIGLRPGRFEQRVKDALERQKLEISDSARPLRQDRRVLMGQEQPGTPFQLISPIGKIIETDRPQFEWRPLPGADHYVVSVYDDKFNKIAASPALKQTSWRPVQQFRRGAIFKWQVTAIKNDEETVSPIRPAPEARFKILESRYADELNAIRSANGNSHLLRGIVYSNAGMLDKAEREFRALLNKNPRSAVARSLLRKVRAAR
jgi:hypothetical protein